MIGYWKDGKPLYQKTINFGALPNAITKNVAHGISNLDYVTNIFCVASNSDGSIQATLPYLNPRSDTNDVSIKVNGNDIQIVSASDMSAFIKTFVTVQYTKTTDTASSLQVENSLLLNRPDLWEVGTEYHFGGGLYAKLVSQGGSFELSGSTKWKGGIGVTGYGDLDSTFWINTNSPYDLNLDFVNSRARGNLTVDYDAWVIYKK